MAGAGWLEMPGDLSDVAKAFLHRIFRDRGTRIEIREPLRTGKSGAVVAIVDCSGTHDGIYVLKVDTLPTGWEGESRVTNARLPRVPFLASFRPSFLVNGRPRTIVC